LLQPSGSNVGIGPMTSAGGAYSGAPAIPITNPVLHIKSNAAGHATLLRIISPPPTPGAFLAAIEFATNETTTPNQAFNAGKIYGIFDGPSYPQARMSFCTPTGSGTWGETMSLKNASVGGGTINPTASMHLARGDGSYEIKLEGNGGRIYGLAVTGTGGFTLDDIPNGASRIAIQPNGFVGLGVGASYKLDVAGDVNCSGVFRAGGAVISQIT